MDSSDEWYYKNYILCNQSSSDDSSDDESDGLVATLIVNEYIERMWPVLLGSLPGRSPTLDWNQRAGQIQLYGDYFRPHKPTYPPKVFRRRFRMRRSLFNRIRLGVMHFDDYFICKPDACGALGFSSYQKCTAAVRMLAYGIAGDLVDEYVRMSESTCLEAMYKFCRAVVQVFGPEYLREPNATDMTRLLAINEARGFPGMIGSIDCMHWEWRNCPFAWQGQYKGHVGACTVVLEAVASQDLWIWHSFFGMAGSHNDINVLQRSPVFNRLSNGMAPQVTYEINGHEYDKPYYLADGIYPTWTTFVKTISNPNDEKKKRFAKEQESARKDVERAFGALQSRWAIVRHPARTWDKDQLWEVMTACVIMHNMIVEDERDEGMHDPAWQFQGQLVEPQGPSTFAQFLDFHRDIREKASHLQLQRDLVEHVWQHYGDQ
jgi:hypothetical protein